MTRKEIKKVIDPIIEAISMINKAFHKKITPLLNIIESLFEENATLKSDNQSLKNELNKIKGEQGQPEFKKSKEKAGNNHSSEKERKQRSAKKPRQPKKKKNANITIDRTVICKIDLDELPKDARLQEYKPRIIQDIKIVTDNVKFLRAVYYSPSENKTFIAPLPDAYTGQFGPGVRASTLFFVRECRMTQPILKRFFETFGIDIGSATISRFLTDNHELWHQEKEDILDAGLASSRYHGLDDTSSRVNGKSYYTHILCNDLYTAYFTLPRKDRLTILTMLCRGPLKHQFNQETYDRLVELGLPNKSLQTLQDRSISQEQLLSSEDCHQLLESVFPNLKKQSMYKKYILEASAITYYKSLPRAIDILMTDDAPQFNLLTEQHALCWIHELRHYKKLHPLLDSHQNHLDHFLNQAWDLYQKLLDHKSQPNSTPSSEIENEFDVLFSTQTGYQKMDKRIALTRQKKKALLLALTFPCIPLHNNASELGARSEARYRDIHLQTKNDKGTQAKDTFSTIMQTARKLCVNRYHYLYDRISGTLQMPSLAELIAQKSQTVPDTS